MSYRWGAAGPLRRPAGPGRRARRGIPWRLATASAVLGAAALGTVLAGTISASPAGAAPSCSASAAQVHYETVMTSSVPGATQQDRVIAVDIGDLSSGCDGDEVVLVLGGNPAGAPTAPASTLSTADSAVDPCTQEALPSPVVVTTGSIRLGLCPAGGPAGYASVHDLTAITLSVNGQPVPLSPPSGAPSSGFAPQAGSAGAGTNGPGAAPRATAASAGQSSGAAQSSGVLAFTGADILATAVGGALIALGGALLVLWERHRRRRSAARPLGERQV